MTTAAVNRRTFVACAAGDAVVAAAATLPLVASADEVASEPFDACGSSARPVVAAVDTIECGVAVVGAGAAGLMAALHAAELGYKVCLLEKGPSAAASNFAQCGGPNACETKIQEAEGEWVSLDDMCKYMYGFSNTSVNAKLLKNVLAGTGPAINKMREPGVPMELWGDPYGVGFRGRHYILADGFDCTEPLVQEIERLGTSIVYGADVYAVLMEGGVAKGAQADIDGTVTDVLAKVTAVCTGGFLGNEVMQRNHFNTPVSPWATRSRTERASRWS